MDILLIDSLFIWLHVLANLWGILISLRRTMQRKGVAEAQLGLMPVSRPVLMYLEPSGYRLEARGSRSDIPKCKVRPPKLNTQYGSGDQSSSHRGRPSLLYDLSSLEEIFATGLPSKKVHRQHCMNRWKTGAR
jgi:hypothetical protein